MKFLQSLSAQVSLRTQGAILALGLLFIILDALTEPMNPAIDLAWVTAHQQRAKYLGSFRDSC